MKVTLDDAVTLGIDKLVRNDVPRNEAEIAAHVFLEGELWGKRTHGFNYLAINLKLYHNARKYRRDPKVERETGVSALIDGGFHFPQFVHDMGMKRAIERAKHNGMGMVGVCNAGASGLLGYYSQLATEAGLIGIAINGTPAAVVPPHGKIPMLGTNPLTIGIPQTGKCPLILDMSTSSVTYNQVRQAKREHQQLPPGTVLDREGKPTTDPDAAMDEEYPHVVPLTHILPFASYKGFGLSLMIEILCAASFGTPVGESKLVPDPHANEAVHSNGIYLVFRPDLFVPRDTFDTQVAQLIADIQNTNNAEDATAIRIPGKNSQRQKAAALQAGWIDIDKALYEYLRD